MKTVRLSPGDRLREKRSSTLNTVSLELQGPKILERGEETIGKDSEHRGQVEECGMLTHHHPTLSEYSDSLIRPYFSSGLTSVLAQENEWHHNDYSTARKNKVDYMKSATN